MPGTVDVCCKLPGGLHLTVWRMDEFVEATPTGNRTAPRAVAAGRVTIRGTGRREDDPRIIGGYAVTRGVDADMWARWLEQNKDSDAVRNRLVFAAEKSVMAEGQAREQSQLVSGLEPMNPDKLPAEFARKIEKMPRPAA